MVFGILTSSRARLQAPISSYDITISTSIDPSGLGIDMVGSSGFSMSNNTIRVNNTTLPSSIRRGIGVACSGTIGGEVFCNSVKAYAGATTSGRGTTNFYIRSAPSLTVSCNNADEEDNDDTFMPAIDMHVEGECMGTDFQGNRWGGEYTNMLYGRVGGTTAVYVGRQRLKGNHFQNAFPTSDFEGIFNGVGGGSAILDNRYEVFQNFNGTRNWPQTVNVDDWFRADIGDEYDCEIDNPDCSLTGLDSDPHDLEAQDLHELRVGTLGGDGAYPDRVNWTLRRQVYRALLAKTTWTPEETAFLRSQEDGSVGQYEQFLRELRSIWRLSEADQMAREHSEDDLHSARATLHALEEAGYGLLSAEHQAARGAMVQARLAHSTVLDGLTQSRTQQMSILAGIVSQLPASQPWEQHAADMSYVAVHSAMQAPQDLSEQYEEDVEALAYSCVEAHGPIVYQARAMMHMMGSELEEDALVQYCSEGAQERRSGEAEEVSPLHLYPNPASDIVYLMTGRWMTVRCVVTDGRVITLGDDLGDGEYRVTALPAGLYLLQAQDVAGLWHQSKLLIVR